MKSDFSPSLKVDNLLNLDASFGENLTLFLKAYYEWLETTKITTTNGSGTFVLGETVTGSSTKAYGVVREVGTGFVRIKRTSTKVFNLLETLTGSTSGATGTISAIDDNVIRASGEFQNSRRLDRSVDDYVDYLREELYSSFPKEYYGDRRFIASKFREFYETKGSESSLRFFFRALYNEPIELYFPGEDVLRVSDGNFEKLQTLKVATGTNPEEIFNFLNKTVSGETSDAIGNVVNIQRFFAGGFDIAEFTLKLVSGTFQGGETISNVDDATQNTIIYGMVTGFTINDGGSGYQVGDQIILTGDGSEAEAFVSSIKESPITAISLDATGYGYRLNTDAIINNSGTGGTDFAVRVTGLANTYTLGGYTVGEISEVTIVNRGSGYFSAPTITVIDTTISAIGALSENLITIVDAGNNYAVGDALVISGGSGSNAAGQVASVTANADYSNTVLFEDEFELILDGSYYDKLKTEDWDVEGPIARIELTDFGTGYTVDDLPTITVTSANGTSANLVATNIQGQGAEVTVDIANNEAGIGSIRAIEIRDFGINYTTATANAEASGDGNANVTPIISGLAIRDGAWIDDDGKIDYKFIQDSFYYQDFSYVIRSGIVFGVYKDALRRIVHPAGLQPFGEILISAFINLGVDIAGADIDVLTIEDLTVSIVSLLTETAIGTTGEIEVEVDVESDEVNNVTSLGQQQYVVKPYERNINELDLISNVVADTGNTFSYRIERLIETTMTAPASPYVVSYMNPQAAYPTIFRNIPISEIADETISTYAFNTLLDTYANQLTVTSTITTSNSSP
jgi:hypothetical protein